MFVTFGRFKIINLILIGTCSRMVRNDKSQVDIKQNLKQDGWIMLGLHSGTKFCCHVTH